MIGCFPWMRDEELSSPLKTSLLAWKKQQPEYCVYESLAQDILSGRVD